MSLNDRVKHIASVLNALTNSIIPTKNTLGNYDDQTNKQILIQLGHLKK